MRAAARESLKHGFADARISRIIGKAGTNPRMLYHYFGSKTLLFVAVLEKALSALRQQELQIDVEHRDPREGLLQLFRFHSLSLRAQPASSAAIVGGEFIQSQVQAKIVAHPGNVVSRARRDRATDCARH
jgi:AcrR family transcriptional regulator